MPQQQGMKPGITILANVMLNPTKRWKNLTIAVKISQWYRNRIRKFRNRYCQMWDKENDIPGQDDQIPGQDNIQNHPEYMPPELKVAPAQRTEEQKYNDRQARLDRESKKKLQEQEDEEKMQHLPSDEPKKTKQLRMASSYYDDILVGNMTFWFCKDDHFHVGDSLDLMEFKEGRHTYRTIQTEITYILNDYTGLEDGYCVLSIKVTGAI